MTLAGPSSSSTSPTSITPRHSAQLSPALRPPFTALGRKTARSRAFSSSTKRGLSCRIPRPARFCRRRSSSPGRGAWRTSLSCTVPRISQPPEQMAASLGVSLRGFFLIAKRSFAMRRRTPRSTVQFSSLGCRKRRRACCRGLRHGVALWRVGNRPYLVEHRLAEAERDRRHRSLAHRERARRAPMTAHSTHRRRQPAKRRGLARSLGRDPYQPALAVVAHGRRRPLLGRRRVRCARRRAWMARSGVRVRSGCCFECSLIRRPELAWPTPYRRRLPGSNRVLAGVRIDHHLRHQSLAWCFTSPHGRTQRRRRQAAGELDAGWRRRETFRC